MVEPDDLNFMHKIDFEERITNKAISSVVYVIFDDNKKIIVVDDELTEDTTPEF